MRRGALVLAVVAAAGCFALATPLVQVVYQRGRFTADDTASVAAILALLCFAVPAWIAQQIAARAFYARADTWRPISHVIGYSLLLGAAVRFCHFALFEAELLSLPSYLVDTAYLTAVGCLSWRVMRTTRMVTQYRWLYERTSPLTWRERTEGADR